jgi:predicted phosphodiesterase
LVVSDIHSNLVALDAVLQDAGGFDQVWCLGDIVGYGPQPNECIERLREFGLLTLAGNHDLGVVGKLALWDFSSDAQQAVFFTRHALSIENREWLETLSPMAMLSEFGITLVHGSLRDPVSEYLSTPGIARYNFGLMETAVCLNGHTHVPIVFRFADSISKPEIFAERLKANQPMALTPDRYIINPGSVGQPRDEDARAAYALLDLKAMTIMHRRVRYEIAATQKLMRDAKLPDRLIRRLRFGD